MDRISLSHSANHQPSHQSVHNTESECTHARIYTFYMHNSKQYKIGRGSSERPHAQALQVRAARVKCVPGLAVGAIGDVQVDCHTARSIDRSIDRPGGRIQIHTHVLSLAFPISLDILEHAHQPVRVADNLFRGSTADGDCQ